MTKESNFVGVKMKKPVWKKAKKIQAREKLATISDAIDKALDKYEGK